MTTLCDDRYFTKIDLAKGYQQIPVEQESKLLTSFSTHNGSYQLRMMSFGLINSGATFNKMMRKILKGRDDADDYIDDILAYTISCDSHLQILRNVLTRIQKAGKTVIPTKCYIGYKTIDFTGYPVGKCEVRMEDEKSRSGMLRSPPQRSISGPGELLPQVHPELCYH